MENIMNNMKVLHFCWMCNKAHDASNFAVGVNSILCECGGYVVSPSGKVQSPVVPVVPVWKVEDSEIHWIASKDEEEIRTFYKTLYDEELEEDAEITQVEGLGLTNPFITIDGDPHKLVSINDLIREQKEFPALLASSVW